MMWLFWWSQAVFAAGVCAPQADASVTDGEYRARFELQTEQGHPPCRIMKLGSVLEWKLTKADIVLREWDDSRHVFGPERIVSVGGQWVLHLPEMRADDRLSVKVVGETVDTSALWKEEPVVAPLLSQTMDFEWVADGKPLFGPDGTVARRAKVTREEEAVVGVHQHWWPTGAVDTQCEASIDGEAVQTDRSVHGCALRVDAGKVVRWNLAWTDPHVSSSTEWQLERHDVVRLRGAEFVSDGIVPASDLDGLQFVGPGRLAVRINRIAGQPIDDDAFEEVQYAAKAVSIPEPGVGLEFKGHKGNAETLSVVLQKLRAQVVTGTLPNVHPLKPRKLTRVRKSRWGTPWEQALILARYLEQLKIDAEAFPVRPSVMGPTLVGAPLGYSGAIVRAKVDDEAVWLDPSCSVCGVGEISPSLWGGTLFDLEATKLPVAAPGTLRVEHNGAFVDVSLSGIPALELRRWLTGFPVAERPQKMATRFGGEGAKLVSHEGLIELGAPIRLRIAVQSRK